MQGILDRRFMAAIWQIKPRPWRGRDGYVTLRAIINHQRMTPMPDDRAAIRINLKTYLDRQGFLHDR
jgi:hypothetical protein